MNFRFSYMRIVLGFFLIFCFEVSVRGQIIVNKAKVDYGTITAQTELEQEIYFVNQSLRKAHLLTYDFPLIYDAHISSKSINPGDTAFLRWKISPKNLGSFKHEIPIWWSVMEKPFELKVSGEVQYIDPYANPSCPNFNERPAGLKPQFQFTVNVLDSVTLKPIKKAEILISERGVLSNPLVTNSNGEATGNLPISYYYFLTQAKGYYPKDLYSYVNRKNNNFTILLNPKMGEDQEVMTAAFEEKEIVEDVSSFENDKSEFSHTEYKPNNIVFLVDVSSSMASNGKLELLKHAMIDLANMMRSEDRISLVSYATSSQVLLPPVSGMNKNQIIEQIRSLEAKGSTNGENGLKTAYDLAKREFIRNANNRVYIATDGVFKTSENEAIQKLVLKNKKRNINLSILGIKGSDYTQKKLLELADKGNGTYIQLENFSECGNQLKSLIKTESKK